MRPLLRAAQAVVLYALRSNTSIWLANLSQLGRWKSVVSLTFYSFLIVILASSCIGCGEGKTVIRGKVISEGR